MNTRLARILGSRTRFQMLWPSDAARDALCPFTASTDLRDSWQTGWNEASARLVPLEAERITLMKAHLVDLQDVLMITVESFSLPGKIMAIKGVRIITGFGLREAKDFVESLPKKIGPYTEDQTEEHLRVLLAHGLQAHAPSALERLAVINEEL